MSEIQGDVGRVGTPSVACPAAARRTARQPVRLQQRKFGESSGQLPGRAVQRPRPRAAPTASSAAASIPSPLCSRRKSFSAYSDAPTARVTQGACQPPPGRAVRCVGGGRGVVLAQDRPLGVGRLARDARARLRRHSSQLRQLCAAARRLCPRHRRRLGERRRASRQAATEVPAGAGVPLGALAHAARRIRLVRALAKRKRLPHVRTSAGRAADGARQRFAGEPHAGGVHRVPARRGEEILAREEGEAAVRAAHHSTSRAVHGV